MDSKQTDLSGNAVIPEKKTPYSPPTPCRRCGRTGHFSSVCRAKTDTKGNSVESDSEYDSDKYY